MNCPKCKNTVLKKAAAANYYTCPDCEGIWVSTVNARGFENLIENPASDANGSNPNDAKTGVCPAGHGIMIRAKIHMDTPFYLEKCTACGGIWFDKGEWQSILQNDLIESLDTIWSKSWQDRKRKEQDRKTFLETNKKLLGEAVYQSIMDLSEILKTHPEKSRAMALLQQEINGEKSL